MDIKRAVEFGWEFIKKYPQHKAEVLDYFELMKDEISEGGNTDHEIELFMGACEDLLIEEKFADGGELGKLPYALKKRVENVKKKFGIDITKEMALQAYHWNTKDGMGGSGVGWEIFGQKFSMQEVSRLNKRDSQTVGDTAIVLGKHYSKYANGGNTTSGFNYSIGGL